MLESIDAVLAPADRPVPGLHIAIIRGMELGQETDSKPVLLSKEPNLHQHILD